MSTLAEADLAHVEKDFAGAIRLYRSLIAEDPRHFDAWYGFVSALGSCLQYAEAIATYRRALALRPGGAALDLNLGSALFALGYVTDAVRNYQIAGTATEQEVRTVSLRNLACCAPGDPALDDAAILQIRRAWAAEEAADLPPPGLLRRTVPGKRLRIGYYGAFFAEKHWMKMYMGVINAHDRNRFEVNLIVDGALPSAESGYLDHDSDRIWQVTGVPNAELASHIAAANIDVLINLNGYSHTSRMPLLLHRPAPIQIAWNGMYGTTGFPSVDVLIADHVALPIGKERGYTERIHRVKHTYLPFHVFLFNSRRISSAQHAEQLYNIRQPQLRLQTHATNSRGVVADPPRGAHGSTIGSQFCARPRIEPRGSPWPVCRLGHPGGTPHPSRLRRPHGVLTYLRSDRHRPRRLSL